MKKITSLLLTTLLLHFFSYAQHFTHADTLRGSITPERAWWDVLRYDIEVKPDYNTKTIIGKNRVNFRTYESGNKIMQIDLQEPLIIDSVTFQNKKMHFKKIDRNVWYIYVEGIPKSHYLKSTKHHELTLESHTIIIPEPYINIYYHGKPAEAIRPPWDGGWIWKKDTLGRPWMSVACQGLGASVWYPCKDHQSDEPDLGASLTVTVPDTLVAVGNGRLQSKTSENGLSTYIWEVKNPINNYNIIPYIGKYVNWTDTLHGEKGNLDLSYWVLDYNLQKAKEQFKQVKPMLRCFEHWFGPYPFYEDGYKLVDAPHLGMEHQGAIAYGNSYRNGYFFANKEMIDLSETGWGFKWDFIIVHESGHEWFGNNISTKDIADMWVHESFTNYSETLYTEWLFGKEAGNDYNYGIRKKIVNKYPVIASYGVNMESETTDKYYKGSNMIHTIRHIIDDDEKFRQILRGLNKTYYHQTVTSAQIENYISRNAGIDFSKVFDQYLRTTQIPQLEYYYSTNNKKIFYRWDSCVHGFNMPLMLRDKNKKLVLYPTKTWKSYALKTGEEEIFNPQWIDRNYYIRIKEVQPNN